MAARRIGILLIVASAILPAVHGDGIISFKESKIYIEESSGNAILKVKRTSGSSGLIRFSCEITNSSALDDFTNKDATGVFSNGDTADKECIFEMRDDAIPEGNETFSVTLAKFGQGDGAVGSPNEATITILANDKAYGVIGFSKSGTVDIQEPTSSSMHSIPVLRSIGTYGNVGVDWQIISGPNNGMNDFEKISGTVSFADGQSTADLTLEVKPDNIPENDEVFTIRLTSPQGGAELNTSFKDLQIRIPANDAPVRFPLDHIQVRENQSSVQVQVYRGLQNDGVTTIGDINTVVNVNWYLIPGKAHYGKDFQNKNGTIQFASGVTKSTININIINDATPELAENFTIHLKTTSPSVYIIPDGVAVVTILPNDDQHGVFVFGSFPKSLDEDRTNVGSFIVNRTAGTFGSASVSWTIVPENGASLVNVFNTTSGVLNFNSMQNIKAVNIAVTKDNVPEEAAEFYIQLSHPTGGSRLANTVEAQRAVFYVKDSDDVYGVVEFAGTSQQHIIRTTSPRRLSLMLERNGGALRSITVNYSVEYYLPNVNVPNNALGLTPHGHVKFVAGQKNSTFDVVIPDDGFLKLGSAFKIVLNNVQLDGVAPKFVPSTPRLGPSSIIYLNVTTKDADGEIGFAKFHQTLAVQEPSGTSPRSYELQVVRDGTAERATVDWSIKKSSGDFTSSDAGPPAGTVVFAKGQQSANITIHINPDNLPELDEVFVVTLGNVSSPNKLQTGMETATITISSNDNPGGTFIFKNTTSLVLKEGDAISIEVIRLGSALDERKVAYKIVPSGTNDFFGSTLTLTFGVNVRTKQREIFVREDNLPEIAEHFQLMLLPAGPVASQGTLGNATVINITLEENDDPYGIIEFASLDLKKQIEEVKGKNTSVTFNVNRNKGTFGSTDVSWEVLGAQPPGIDIHPTQGVIRFIEGDKTKHITVNVLNDVIPEGNETFTISLKAKTGKAQFGSQLNATLIITKNDVPVFFAAPTTVNISEGQTANLTIRRGNGLGSITVAYKSFDGTALVSDSDYVPVDGTVVFGVGETSKEISIVTRDDNKPEGVEDLTVKLINSSGDTVIQNGVAMVTIYASDAGTGVFQFVDSGVNQTVSERGSVKFDVSRLIAQHGKVHLFYQVLRVQPDGSLAQLPSGTDFVPSSFFVEFADQEKKETISISPLNDNIAEMNETFAVQILNATGIGTGENGRLGNITIQYFRVLSNDDPHGVFRFLSTDVKIPEDYSPSEKNTTEKNVSVVRDQGLWGNTQVLWEITTAGGSIKQPGQFDLLFLSNLGPGVRNEPSKRRPNTGTNVTCFNDTQTGSYATVSLFDGETLTELSISSWLQADEHSLGYLLSYGGNGLAQLEVALNTTGLSTSVFLSLFDANVTVDLGKEIADGNWHQIVLNLKLSNQEATFYVDGKEIGITWKSFPGQSLAGGGVFTVGSSDSSKSSYSGCVQDLRVYKAILEDSQVTELFSDIVDVTPVNGYLSFPNNVREKDIYIKTVDDVKPEDEKKFRISLITAKGGARLDKDKSSTTLTVLKSDNANGLFGFDSISALTVTETTNQSITIDRKKGTSGGVTVTWGIYKYGLTGLELASEDFTRSQGTIVFSDGDVQEIFYIKPKDDQMPELDEQFILKLVSAKSNDGKMSSTETSGASVDPNFTEINITITKNDYPYGLLQFMNALPSGNATIPPAVESYRKDVRESAGSVDLSVVRAQGSEGSVQVSWRIQSQTAVSPDDYKNSAGVLNFAPGQRSSKISIKLKDDQIPELNKTFGVVLYDPKGGVELSPLAKVAEVTILPSDDAFGVMNFSQDSIKRTVNESSTISLTVLRRGGNLGAVTVFWQVIGPNSNDVKQTNGSVVLSTGKNSTTIMIEIADDVHPELSESFIVSLVNVSRGRLAKTGITANITIHASDQPYGIFQFNPTVLSTTEQNKTISLVIRRLGGSYGSVRVYYKSHNFNDLVGSLKQTAKPGQDFVALSDSLLFGEGVTNATVSLQVLGDDIPEDVETILVSLTKVEIVKHSTIVPVPVNSPVIGRDKVVRINIQRNDNASGVVQLSADRVVVTEPYLRAIVNATRLAGAFGKVVVKLVVIPGTAQSPSDYVVLYNNVTFQDGQTTARVPVEIVNDNDPEKTESFTIRLLESDIQGGALLGYPRECVVTIAENDYPYGLIGFEASSISIEAQEPSKAVLKVIRTYGSEGANTVHWEATYRGMSPVNDTKPTSGDLVFPSGSDQQLREKTIEINILDDNVAEIPEVIQVTLTNVTSGKAVINEHAQVANLTIAANDDPHGVVEFAKSSYTAIERPKAISKAYLEIRRKYGSFGNLRLFYSTKLIPGSSVSSQDFTPVTNGSITIPQGQTSSNITIDILNDTMPELNELFSVVLERVELIGQLSKVPPRLGVLRVANVTIVKNDYANGRFIIRAINPDPDTGGVVKTVLEKDTSVSFEILRTGGTIGKVSVKWSVDQTSNATGNGKDFRGSGGSLEFGPGVTRKDAVVEILPDDIPETDEVIVIKLTDPTNGATVAIGHGNNLTIIISANDKVAGEVGFSKSSQSVVTAEGERVVLSVERTNPAAGVVRVLWAVHGKNASNDFDPWFGSVTFSQGQTKANISFQVRSDSTPEPNELFLIKLSNITTYEIAASGAAELIPDQISSTLSVRASNEPHGVIEFQSGSRDFATDEANRTITLTLTRLYGTIGSIRVNYEVKTGNITVLQQGQRLASDSDFRPNVSSVIIGNGKSTGQIPVQIIDDHDPEISEVFIVNITSVELVNTPYNTSGMAPRLGTYRSAQVMIRSNDNPRGLLGFSQTKYYVNESSRTYDVIVERTQGTLGTLPVIYYIKSNTAIEGTDFVVPANPGGEETLTFKDGERTKNITVRIIDDNIPEDDEVFRIHLKETEADTLRSGYTITEVVIVHNDDGRGVFSFKNNMEAIAEPGNGPKTSATFNIVRKVASLGQVVIGWRVLNDSASNDVRPTSGNVTFGENDKEKSFTISSMLDSTPEKDEIFTIGLYIVSNSGGRIEAPSIATLTITENDYPYGELEILSSLLLSSINVEENVGTVQAKIRRTKGNFGRISVGYETIQGSAVSPIGDVVHFEMMQGLKTVGAKTWYSFSAYGNQYLILASNSSGDKDGYSGSSLFRWQGVFTKVQSFATDGAVSWDSIVVNDVVYLAVANYGEDGRTETNSNVYRFDKNGVITSIQNITTKGASDLKFFKHGGQYYLIVANSKSNSLDTVLKSKVYRWQAGRFVDQNADFDTRAASGLAVFSINGDLLLAVSSYFDKISTSFVTKSPILKWQGSSFQPYKEVSTNGPIGVQYFENGGDHFLVFGNSKGPVAVHQWKTDKFELVQSLGTSTVKSVFAYNFQNKVHLCTVDNGDEVKIFSWNNDFQLQMNTTVPFINSAVPMTIADPVAGEVQLIVAAVSGSAVSSVITPVKLSASADFIPRKGQLIFENGQTELGLDFSILQDNTPEKDESFSIVLSNATGKAVTGSKRQLTVTILSNNNAHGRIGFSQDSLKLTEPEGNTVVNFEVIREYGQFGRVVVLWNATGDYRKGQISPVYGALVFADGVSRQNISIRLQDDNVPELDKVISIRLLSLNETGSLQPGRGAVINTARALATLTIPGNDDPYGVISWLKTHFLSQASTPTNKTVTLTMNRGRGLIGTVIASFQTQPPTGPLPSNEQSAVGGVDYVSKQGQVVMADGVNSAGIDIEIIHKHLTPINKLFIVNITSVSIQPGSPSSPLVTNSPRISLKARLLEVVISQNNQSLGEINFNVSSSRIQTTEGSTVKLMLVRNGSVTGRVGLRYVVRPSLSQSLISASSSDFSPENGTVYFESGEDSKYINIDVNDDNIPELKEEFYVVIVSPINGVIIGGKRRVDVEIKQNDDPKGVFGFKVSPLEFNRVEEGKTVRLEVIRSAGSYGQVDVKWQLDRITSQLTPYNGTLTFREGVRSQYILLLATDDSTPEASQVFKCSLISANNQAKINVSRNEARVVIPENDNAKGVISIDSSTRRLFVGEPNDKGYDGVFSIRILRSVGQIGNVILSWQITKITPSALVPSQTFNISTGSVTFTDGVKAIPIVIKVKQDSNPEEFASYLFKIISVSGILENSTGVLEARIDVAASDSPYGVMEFDSPVIYNETEGIRFVNLTVRRNQGDVGRVKVNLTVSGSTASEGKDFTISNKHLDFSDKESQKKVSIAILNDDNPELKETVSVHIQSVELIPTRVMNYSIIGGLQPDEPPKIGTRKTVTINVLKNDDAHGVIQFKDTRKTIHEEDRRVVLMLERSGGTLGNVEVYFVVHNGTATFGKDYTISKGSVFFTEKQKVANITIPIVDDADPEQQETFTVTLRSISGGATLGANKVADVIIVISDNPSGLLGFVNATGLELPNPNLTKSLTFGIARNGGAQGEITVKWQLVRLNPGKGNVSSDFFPPYSGTLTYNNGDGKTQFIRIRLDAYKGPEPEEQFLLKLHDATGGADIDVLKSNITITVLKYGFPNGIFRFKDTSHITMNEPDTGKTKVLSLQVERTIGFEGDVKVYWKAIGSVTQDLVKTSGNILFNAKVMLLNLEVGVKGDDVPELSENFTIMLYKVDGGGDLDTRGQNVTVTIRANDDPHGIFKLKSGSQSLQVNIGLSRTLQFTVQRDSGTFGDVQVDYSVTYSSWYPTDLSGSLTIKGGDKESTKNIDLSKAAFLDVNSRFRVTLTRVQFSSGTPALPSSPKLATSSVSEAISVPESAANAVLRFADNSLKLAVAPDNTTTIMVLRQGLYGDVGVTWKMGYPTDSSPSGYTAGKIEPETGSLVFNGQTTNKTFTVKANPVTPDRKLVYAVHLSKTTTSSNVAANITSGPKRTAVIEYSGVIEIAPDARTLVVTEGSKVSCQVIRLFSIFGAVQVTYNGLGTTGSFNMADGEFSKSFEVTAQENNNPEKDYTSFINLTQVTGSNSPRLGSNTVSIVTIKDNDNANGIISFGTKALKKPENETSALTYKVSLGIQRTAGTLGTVTVIVRSVGGGEPWDRFASPKELVDILDKRSKDSSAVVGKDYDQLLETVTFAPGVTSKTVQLTIRNDDVPEPDETVFLYLANVTGGAVLGTTARKLQSWSVVTIEGNDLMNGQVGYVAGSTKVTIDEDGLASATLLIERIGANFGSVTVVWRVREPGKRSQLIEFEGTAVFKPGYKETTFTIRLRDDKLPEFQDSFHVDLVELQNTAQARINPAASSALITVLDSDYPYGVVGFAPASLYTAVNLKTTQVSLKVLRDYGTTTDIVVTYTTEMLPAKSVELGIATSQALVGQDYKQPTVTTMKIDSGKTSVELTLTLTPETPSDSSYPKAFRVKIINATNSAAINNNTETATVIISNDEDTTRFLALKATSQISPLTDEAINKILSDLKTYVKKPLNDDRLTLTNDTINNILREKRNRPTLSARRLQDISKTTLMDIFDELLDPSRSDTKGVSKLAYLFDQFAFALAYGESCPASDPLVVKGKYANARAFRKTLDSLNGQQINSLTTDKHSFSYPSNMFIGLDNKQKSACNDIHFIEYHNSHWFTGTVLSDKILSTSLNDLSTVNKNNMYPYTYIIYTGKKRVTPKGASCVYWDFGKNAWSNAGCSVKSDKEDYVECQCNHLSNFASQGQSDDRVGYSTYFFAACFVCLGAFALALLSHHACSVENLFSAKLLMHMFFACMAAHLMYVVGAYVSSSQAVITEDPPVRCSVLGMFIHYFFLCQFSWMFIQGWNLWRILVLNDEHTDKKYVLFFVLGWGMPVVAIVLYIIITQAALSWTLHDMYGDVHKNGDMCFIPNAYGALASVVAPTLLFLMGVAVVFTQAYQVTMQWRYYDDIYRGHYNIKEVRHVIILFVLVSVTWVFAGVHLAYGYLWTVILFSIFDVILGLYVFILFFILRNQVRGVFKRTYAFQGEPPPIHTHDDFFRGHLGTDSSGSKRFKKSSPEVPSDWDELDNTPRSNRKLMVNMNDTGSLGEINDTYEDDFETQDFDDLIFALKTGGHFDPNEDEKPSSDQEHYELRRISIPDTHL